MGLMRSPSEEAVASQIAVLLSNAVLCPVVDSLGLRVKLRFPRGPRNAVLERVEAGPGALPTEYVQRLHRRGSRGGGDGLAERR